MIMGRIKKCLAWLLVFLLALSCLAIGAAASGEVSGEASDEETDVSGVYTCGGMTLTLAADDTFTLIGAAGLSKLSGTYTCQVKTAFWGTTVSVSFDEISERRLRAAGVIPWYGDGSVSLGEGAFSICIDVSEGLITDDNAYRFETAADPASPTGYTTTITVTDDGYESVLVFGDWLAVRMELTDPDDPSSYSTEMYAPDDWENGMDYCSSSVIPMVRGEDGSWSLTLPLASSVMGVIAYHDVAEADLVDPKPQKLSFFVPYDAEKQSESFDWSAAFPAEEQAGTLHDLTVTASDGSERSVSVYTPYGYDPDTEYLVVYLIPGGGSNYLSWFTNGMVHNIFDNLTAAGQTEPTLLVSMQREDANGGYLDEIMRYVEENFHAADTADRRALVGVSMGSVAATQLWLEEPGCFGYYGFLSGAEKSVFRVSEEGYEYEELSPERIAELSDAVIFLGGGTTDFNMFTGDGNSASVYDLAQWMDHYGIPHNAYDGAGYRIAAGDHNWPIWIKLMIPFASEYLW